MPRPIFEPETFQMQVRIVAAGANLPRFHPFVQGGIYRNRYNRGSHRTKIIRDGCFEILISAVDILYMEILNTRKYNRKDKLRYPGRFYESEIL
jgi:hypothetical protein